MNFFCRMIKKPADATPHLMIAASVTLLVLFVTDRFNGAMNFVAHELTAAFILAAVCIYVYQTVVYCIDFAKSKRLIALTVLNVMGCAVGIYLFRLCYIDLTTEMVPHMLKETNKFVLLAFSLLTFSGSVITALVQRANKIRENREISINTRRQDV